ncbi:MAG: YraN family protein [Pseudomonadota bacterium]
MTGRFSDERRRKRAERKGRFAELLVRLAYSASFYEILETRFRAPGGEIDLIARKGRLLAFVEVKLRKDVDAAILAVTPASQRRIERAASSYLSLRPHFGEFAVRYDIAAVSGLRVALLKDAWREPA